LITGAVKKELREKEITLSPPQIIPDTGAHQFPETAPVITIPIETGKGNVFIDISYAERVNGGRIIEECL
jgi:CheY-specific phosphatase CheX